MKKSSFRVLARHKWVLGATITESVRRDSATDENGVSIRRFTATIRGFRNWKIYEGPAGNDIVGFIINLVTGIRDKIDEGDIEVFDQPNKFVAIDEGWQKIEMYDFLGVAEYTDIYRWRPSNEETPLSIRHLVEMQVFVAEVPQLGWEDVLNVNMLIHASQKVVQRS